MEFRQVAESMVAGSEDEAREIALDPFALLPDAASKVAGLGGSEPCTDENYVFHTHYVHVAEGHAHFRIRFRGLTGKFGTVLLRVHMYQKGSAEARLALSEQMLLSRLIAAGGSADVRFEAFLGVTYALYGSIAGFTDAAATGLEIALDRPGDENATLLPATEARNSAYGRDTARAARNIISLGKARLAAPVSQIATEPQRRERAARRWTQSLVGGRDPIAQWSAAYCLEAMERYGVLQAGAHGVGLEAAPSGVAALAIAAGPSVTVVDPREDGEAVRREQLSAVAVAPEGAHARLDHRALPFFPLARDLVNFDFLWSDRVATRLGSTADALRFVDRAMSALRPGGLAVHVFDFALPPLEEGDVPGIFPLRRRELDRLALILISRGHVVAQLRIDREEALLADGSGTVGACGLIVRKAETVE